MISATKPLLSDNVPSRSRCFIPFLGLLFLLSFLFVRRHDFIEKDLGTDWVNEVTKEEQDSTPPLPRPPDVSPPKKSGKAPMRDLPAESSDQYASQAGFSLAGISASHGAGSPQAGSSASHAAGSPQAGSSASHAGGSPQAGPSGLSPPPMIRREVSPEISVIGEDMSPEELLVQQRAYEHAQAAAQARRNPMEWINRKIGYWCDGVWGVDRKKLTATSRATCQLVARMDPECSDTIYFCSAPEGFYCRCVMKGQVCLEEQWSSAQTICTIQDLVPATVKVAACTDPEFGFEKQVGSCEQVTSYATFSLTMNSNILIPLVINSVGKCDARVCQKRDTYNCCRPRRKCNPNYVNDVNEGCPANEIVNPYIGAYCRTYPCTIGDIDTCCVDPNSLWQRTDLMRSQYPRTVPDDSAAPVSPRVTFGYHDLVWLDISQKQEVNGEEWCPLMNFMKTWYKGGWSTPAWLRLSKKGKMLYRPAPKEKLQIQHLPYSPALRMKYPT